MTALELFIRPFQLGVLTPPTTFVGVAQPQDTVPVSIGEFGSKTFSYSYNFSAESQAAQNKFKETSRTTETKRVTNPQDPSQFVDIKRATEINFADENDPKKNKTRYTYKYPDDQGA